MPEPDWRVTLIVGFCILIPLLGVVGFVVASLMVLIGR
jgi:hypothetical protein